MGSGRDEAARGGVQALFDLKANTAHRIRERSTLFRLSNNLRTDLPIRPSWPLKPAFRTCLREIGQTIAGAAAQIQSRRPGGRFRPGQGAA